MTIALFTFSVTYLLLILEKFPRFLISLVGAIIVIATGVMTLDDAVHFISWDTIGLLLGMFIIIRILEEGNFFNYLAVKIIEKLNYNIYSIYFVFPLVTAILSGFMDSITVLIFFTILTINLSRIFNLNPVPLVIAEVCTANIGGSATLVGDPPNVILGSLLGYGFNDFVINNGPVAFVSTVFVALYFLIIKKGEIKNASKLTEDAKIKLLEENKITNPKYIKIGTISFGFAILFLVFHHLLNKIFGFNFYASISTLLPALISLLFIKDDAENITRTIDGETLLFFIGLFVVIGSLEKTGAISYLANKIISFSNGNITILILLFIWGCGVISAIVDNVPMALTMAYILKSMLATNPELAAFEDNLVFSLALGLDIGGNMTPIGASANVMAYSILEKNKYHIGWFNWIKLAVPPTLLALLISSIGMLSKL
ncbi:Inner membrane protein YbiR [Caloramator mitchellensis]|uniref:Inner membrane protein YbiR n=1 Tax=Caloramator mitchellensis TaxID=908809 RepID=A0A0R3JVD8_CALMK|nr:SLC13 family permease [Caloramator mitchellensis]KRQ87489.1 Inner membrane protein YbiR [Caloramator mitchellensis]